MVDEKDHYVNNKELVDEIKVYKDNIREAEKLQGLAVRDKGFRFPQMHDRLGEMLIKIAERLASRPNFANYTYRDEMVLDGIENCIRYLYNFDPEKSNNAFAYVTQMIWYAFLRRIQAEKKQQYIKYKQIEESGYPNLRKYIQQKSEMHDGDPRKEVADKVEVSDADIEKYEKKK